MVSKMPVSRMLALVFLLKVSSSSDCNEINVEFCQFDCDGDGSVCYALPTDAGKVPFLCASIADGNTCCVLLKGRCQDMQDHCKVCFTASARKNGCFCSSGDCNTCDVMLCEDFRRRCKISICTFVNNVVCKNCQKTPDNVCKICCSLTTEVCTNGVLQIGEITICCAAKRQDCTFCCLVVNTDGWKTCAGDAGECKMYIVIWCLDQTACSEVNDEVLKLCEIARNCTCALDSPDQTSQMSITSQDTAASTNEPTDFSNTPDHTSQMSITSQDTAASTNEPTEFSNTPTSTHKKEVPLGDMIVGVVIGIVLLVSVSVLLLFLLRRRRRARSKRGAGAKYEDAELQVCGNSNRGESTENENEVNVVDGHRSQPRSSQYSCHDYSVIEDLRMDESSSAFKPMASLYSTAQVTVKQLSGSNNRSDKIPGTSPYEFEDVDEEEQEAAITFSGAEYKKLDFTRRNQAETSSASADNASDYSHLETAEAKSKAEGTSHVTGEENNAKQTKQAEKRLRVYHILEEATTGADLEGAKNNVYHILEEDTTVEASKEKDARVYHILEETGPTKTAKDKEAHSGASLHQEDAKVYHILEEGAATTSQTNDTPVYHILEEDHTLQPANKRRAGDTLHVSRGAEGESEEGAGSEYNSLDFDRKTLVGMKTKSDTDAVYSHLNEENDGTYNEVNRKKRTEVIDGEYSCIK